ncbi:SusC/RagA family TonB-linked outer membrane protein [Psychroserpens sp. SPM9]|uniref:SusC/RagA family TonB-linked outer membrane protein n=1 Tax=Psychroserpens sp. SPM9 TaxID=2975598 RepID=UPI0021A46D2C|nr:SusC/RagA family TonB-linked outer membrane protein [Psychroserpens sp. SPM9]MDG5490049.1 SusC/RagA family TonB-linked outer membrane protein [Psychroserpens sp. SPM9]
MKVKNYGLVLVLLFLSVTSSFAQERTITGKVTSAEDGMPLIGVNVIVKGTSRGQQTDFDGGYSIQASTGETLVFSYLGTKTIERLIGETSTIDVIMEADNTLDEVVVVAYGGVSTLKKNPAAISTVKAEILEDRANASALQNLQGQVAGLNIATGSGQPGEDSTIILRGAGSINGNIEPLFIVDGIPVDEDNFRSINPNDIETFTVLKDAGAANIYGNRAANGAIVITTKKGRYNEGMKFRYSAAYGNSELQDQPFELMNSTEILQFQRTNNAGLGAGLTDSEIAAIAAQANTSWADVFFRTGRTESHDLTMTSGGEKSNNFTSLQYFKQDGIFVGSDFQRFSLRNNFNGKTEDEKFNYGLNLFLAFSETNELDNAGSGSTFFNPFSAALQGLPYLSIYDADGSQTIDGGITPGDANAILSNGATNFPYVLLNSIALNTDREEEIKILASFNSEWNFAKNLYARVQMGADLSTESRLEILHPNSILGPFQANVIGNQAQFGGIHEETYTRDFRFNVSPSISYSNVFNDKHDVTATAYFEYSKGFLDGIDFDQTGLDPRLVGTGTSFIPGTTVEQGVNPYIPVVNSFTSEVGNLSVFGTLDYEYDGRYGISAGIRRDNSFRFIEDNAWGTFWSVAGRWNISDEAFMDGSGFDLLKLRASHGVSGNDRITGGYYGGLNQTRSLYVAGTGYNGSVSTVVSQLENRTLKWEETTQTNIGIDFAILDNKLSGSVDVYNKTTDDLFQNNQISLINATSTIQSNIGSLVNEGIELALNYRVFSDEDWKISVAANGSYNENTIEQLPPSTNGLVNTGGSTALGEGQALGSYYLVRYLGVNPSNGNPLFLKADGVTVTETLDAANDRVFLDKSFYPTWQGGFSTDVRYKGFELSTQWSFVADVWLNNLDYADLQEVSVGSVNNGRNRSVTVNNAWQTPGDITDIPRVGSTISSVGYINSTDRYLEDASYLRLRNITFAYTIPTRFLENTPISGVRFYLQGENLLTFTKFRGWDPESNFRATNRGQFPTPKIYTFGATINF